MGTLMSEFKSRIEDHNKYTALELAVMAFSGSAERADHSHALRWKNTIENSATHAHLGKSVQQISVALFDPKNRGGNDEQEKSDTLYGGHSQPARNSHVTG